MSQPVAPRLVLGGILVLLALRVLVAWDLGLLGDEAYYWQCSRRLDLAFSDLPAGTALLVAAGTRLFGDAPLAVRSAFLVLGALVPAALLAWARPLVGEADAWAGLGFAMLLPLSAWLGCLAVPDGPLVLASLAFAAALERAAREPGHRWWVAVGLAGACGFLSHYRFLFPAAGAALWLALSARGRSCLARPGPWLAAGLAGAALLPTLAFNLRYGMAPALSQFRDRHPWTFDPSAWEVVGQQARFATPLLYVLLLATAVRLLSQAREGDERAQLAASQAVFPLALVLALSPFTDRDRMSAHWILTASLLLSAWVPGTVRVLRARLPGPAGALAALVAASAGLGVAALLACALGLAHPDRWPPELPFHWLTTRWAGWDQVAARVEARLAELGPPGTVPVVIDIGPPRAAVVEYALRGRTRVLAVDRGRSFGRSDRPERPIALQTLQYRIWDCDAEALAGLAGRDALVLAVAEDGTGYTREAERVLGDVGPYAGALELLERSSWLGGAKQVGLYALRGVRAAGPVDRASLPLPPRMVLDHPVPGAVVGGPVEVDGWAFCDGGGIAAVEVLVDGRTVGAAKYGGARPDVATAFPQARDPRLPAVGFASRWDSRGVPPGPHRLGLRVRTGRGVVEELAGVAITVAASGT